MSDLFSSNGDFGVKSTGFGLATGNELYNSGVNSWDTGYEAQRKVDEYREKQREIYQTKPGTNISGVYVPAVSGHRKAEYSGLISGLILARLIVVALIFAAGFFVFWFGMEQYGPRLPSQDSHPVFSDTLSKGRSKEWIAKVQPANIKEFKDRYGLIYKEDAPFNDLFKGCRGSSCAEADYAVVSNFRQHAKNKDTYWSDFCARNHAISWGESRQILPVQWSIQLLNIKHNPYSHKCVITNMPQIKAAYDKEVRELTPKLSGVALIVIGLGFLLAVKAGVFKSRATSEAEKSEAEQASV